MTALEFLRAIHPDGPWALAAIDPDLPQGHPDKIKCRTMGADEVGLARFIERHNDHRNIYYQLNRVRPNLGKKRARKIDVVACVGLHCEIDPPDGVEDLARWQRSKRADLVAWKRTDLPRPTRIVFSGSGFQPLWLLDEPTTRVEAVESRNRMLAYTLGGDSGTWAVDRLLRLPGTLNHPGEKKRAKYGRTDAVLAEVVS